jgi:hypothetical protein
MAIKSISSIKQALPLLALAFIISGCGQAAPAGPPTATPKPTAVPTRKPRPRPTEVLPTATPVPNPQVDFFGVSFLYNPTLGGVIGAQVPADTDDIGSPDWKLPERAEFTVVNYPPVKTSRTPKIVVFPIAPMTDFNDVGAERIQALADLLKAKPEPDKIVEPIPQMSDMEEDELMHAQVKYLDFQNGSGVRFISEYSSDVRPINNEDLVYVFQGITTDGKFYVAIMLPLTQIDLIENEDALTSAQADAMLSDYNKYLSGIAKDLTIADGASFIPKLSLLDKVVTSFNIAPDALPAMTATEPGSDTSTEQADATDDAEPADATDDAEPDITTPTAP